MKYISRGWQYSVYDLGNDRVHKRYNTIWEAFLVMLKSSIKNRCLPQLNFASNYFLGREYAKKSLILIENTSLDRKIFGNPKIGKDLSYEQDYLMPLSQYFKEYNEEESINKINDLVVFSKFLKDNSIVDRYFNMANNFGLNKSGEITIIDLGEISVDSKEIDLMIRRRVWATGNVLDKFPKNLRKYFVDEMNKVFILSQLMICCAGRVIESVV